MLTILECLRKRIDYSTLPRDRMRFTARYRGKGWDLQHVTAGKDGIYSTLPRDRMGLTARYRGTGWDLHNYQGCKSFMLSPQCYTGVRITVL